jgi:tetrapyrrole methylase family protein/MazG family protein
VTSPTVRVVGLGPGDGDLVTARTRELLTRSPVVRLRTRVHPAALGFADVVSYDDAYERASSFDELYRSIADDLVSLAESSPNGEVVYAVPGSPVVAERTVELLRARQEVRTVCEPAVSVIDVACCALGRDPMSVGLRIVDALAASGPLRGPGPVLVLQTYGPEVLATVSARLAPTTKVTVLHHLGLPDELVTVVPARDLAAFAQADHLTSLWIEELRTPGVGIDDLVELMTKLRRECPWDQEQTHASLTRHLLEEAYEALDALEAFVRADGAGPPGDDAVIHVREELGDLLFQIVFHAELGSEEGLFDLGSIADAVRLKLIGRHPHVFGDVRVDSSDDVASRWEKLKREEKGRQSVTDGIAWQLPALTLYSKLLRKAALVDLEPVAGADARDRALRAMASLEFRSYGASDAASASDVDVAWGDSLTALLDAARWSGVDLEAVLRDRASQLRDEIRRVEGRAIE